MALAVRQVEEGVADARRGAVRKYVLDPGGEEAAGEVGSELQPKLASAEDLPALAKRL